MYGVTKSVQTDTQQVLHKNIENPLESDREAFFITIYTFT